jgi:hypothetical protein
MNIVDFVDSLIDGTFSVTVNSTFLSIFASLSANTFAHFPLVPYAIS